MTQTEAIAYWMGADRETFVAVEDGRVFGTYFLLRPNQLGGGAHVANCGKHDLDRSDGARDCPQYVHTFARPRPEPGGFGPCNTIS